MSRQLELALIVLVLFSNMIISLATLEWTDDEIKKREQFEVADDQIDQLRPEAQKRNLFISDGWGPGGSSLIQSRLPSSVQMFNGRGPKQSNPHRFKSKQTRKNSLSSRKWTIPGLFGQI